MVEKSGFYGDVGQAVVGNVIEAPRQSNVVNLTIGSRTEFRPLTKLQRQDVTTKVKALVALDGGPALNVYRVLLNSFGAANMDTFPGDKYMAAMALLDARIVALQNVPAPVSEPVAIVAPTIPQGFETVHAAPPCGACTRHAAEIKRVRAVVVAQWVLLLGGGLALRLAVVAFRCRCCVETFCRDTLLRRRQGLLDWQLQQDAEWNDT